MLILVSVALLIVSVALLVVSRRLLSTTREVNWLREDRNRSIAEERGDDWAYKTVNN